MAGNAAAAKPAPSWRDSVRTVGNRFELPRVLSDENAARIERLEQQCRARGLVYSGWALDAGGFFRVDVAAADGQVQRHRGPSVAFALDRALEATAHA